MSGWRSMMQGRRATTPVQRRDGRFVAPAAGWFGTTPAGAAHGLPEGPTIMVSFDTTCVCRTEPVWYCDDGNEYGPCPPGEECPDPECNRYQGPCICTCHQ